MKMRTVSSRVAALSAVLLVLATTLISANSNSYANPPAEVEVEVSTIERDGTFRPAPGYQPAVVGPEYTSNPPTYGRDDTYAQDEIIIRFRPGITEAQQNALLASHAMRFGRLIYGERAFVAKVPMGSARALANALRDHPLLEMAGVNPVITFQYDPNDPLDSQQQNLDPNHINAYEGWDYGHGLGAVSLIAILDSGMDAGGSDSTTHPEFVDKFRSENWQDFTGCTTPGCQYEDPTGHGTQVGSIAAGSTDNSEGIAATGFSAWPMSLKIDNSADKTAMLSTATSAVNWAADHGASVINMSFRCQSIRPVCDPTDNQALDMFYDAVKGAYLRGITVVAAAGNEGTEDVNYPAAFGQVVGDPWPYNEKLVISVSGTISNTRHSSSSYGSWTDVAAPIVEDSTVGIYGAWPTEDNTYPDYRRLGGTSQSAPQVAGLASLLTTLGYTNTEVYDFIMDGATDLPCAIQPCAPGYDIETGWGKINMGASMMTAARPPDGTNPGMVVVPNAGQKGVQWFNFQGSGFTASDQFVTRSAQICYAPPGGNYQCQTKPVDSYGVAGLGIQVRSGSTGTWSAYMQDVDTGQTTPTKTFTVLP